MSEPYISAYADPEGESPWALQCVVNESNEFSENALAQATAHAVVAFLDAARTNPDWGIAVDRWRQGRIRKILRRAKNARWDKLADEEGVTTTFNGITVRVFVPSAMDEIPANIRKCQVSGIKVTDNEWLELPQAAPCLQIHTNGELDMSPGKTAIAAAHVAHLTAERLTSEEYGQWKENGFPIALSKLSHIDEWVERYSLVAIHDGGLTEVEPGSLTALGIWPAGEK